MVEGMSCCSVCGRGFEVRFRYQVRAEGGRYLYVCSTACQERLLGDGDACRCSVCGEAFSLEFPYQVAVRDGQRVYFCGTDCRGRAARAPLPVEDCGPRRIAVFNHKGGTGKTTTSVNLAAGLAERGRKVLLVDADGQGNVGASLGIRGERGLYHVLVHGARAEDVVVPVRTNLDVLTSNETLAAAELALAQRPNRDRVLRERLAHGTEGYDVVVIDCAPALSLMNQNVLVYADGVLIPVGCDYLSIVGVRQVMKTMKSVREVLRHDVRLVGVLPTFFDNRQRIARDSLATLHQYFGDRCLPAIRTNTKLREAPASRQTIFEFAPDSHGADDYRALVDYVLELTPSVGLEECAVSAAE